MKRVSVARLEALARRAPPAAGRKSIPSWWRPLAPSRGARFWAYVESMRKLASIDQDDRAGMAYLIDNLNRRTKWTSTKSPKTYPANTVGESISGKWQRMRMRLSALDQPSASTPHRRAGAEPPSSEAMMPIPCPAGQALG